jgi:hypothetical protein
MTYQMWHAETANLMEYFDTEAEAVEAVRAYLTPDENGQSVDVFLIVYDDSETPIRSIDGEELARLVFGASDEPHRRSA